MKALHWSIYVFETRYRYIRSIYFHIHSKDTFPVLFFHEVAAALKFLLSSTSFCFNKNVQTKYTFNTSKMLLIWMNMRMKKRETEKWYKFQMLHSLASNTVLVDKLRSSMVNRNGISGYVINIKLYICKKGKTLCICTTRYDV